ncbi:MAG: phenylalanine--tRNA ligase subunit alpha [Candidatus Omnitrophica bacterium CG11_big_fil_rev_8_21_14_0_20_45_26]|uniref:Phenylalanine--tRNA ligase alpha subunit n=1 Tax=Candidatus Abzuiibacterium crystallinum TaxID=1974748 RepID=A0A2H0LS05_9BACT|nr:MAG: phenylalanine--tRNA ligase subunit alpha [Candidatus Omnitrophica bacterium CG11_big_fil_rev_8_21_14_0_20_45_26]PIW64962.1 MAG: phenylalanine--tRNA ligase subunit alpha [Candidatus Omnitrophica bacterium CG12_big_fil_rev_8_21_14_0_65_45_16]
MTDMDFQALEKEAREAIQQAHKADDLEALKVKYLGKKGSITALLKQVSQVPPPERPVFGQKVNQLKHLVQSLITEQQTKLAGDPDHDPGFDPTLDGIKPAVGSLHPITRTIREICVIFSRLGFDTVDGREIETEFYNFTALNIPLDHPSRDAFDTFYTPQGYLLRSQTSTVQVREMKRRKPPLRILAPGRVYRPDAVDASHSFMFHQIEGLMVDQKTNFADLKGVIHLFLKQLFGEKLKMRFRPHFFPFTEPSVEVDIKWGERWLEVLGAGQVNPMVFKYAGYPPRRYQGFAFGLGIERIVMLRYGIKDIRLLFENDQRFLEQFR